MGTVSVRYIVDDVEVAIGFYRDRLGFRVDLHPAPGFASLSRGDLRLLLNAPGAGGAGTAGDKPHSRAAGIASRSRSTTSSKPLPNCEQPVPRSEATLPKARAVSRSC